MPPSRQRAGRFHYDGYTIDPDRGEVHCMYSTGGYTFTERFVFGPEGDWSDPAVEVAVRLLFLVAGVSYYKTTAAEVIDLEQTATTSNERAFLAQFLRNGLAEFAYCNTVDLDDLSILGLDQAAPPVAAYHPIAGRPLIPFGGGIDSIVTVAALQAAGADAALCIVHPPDDRFAAIEEAAAATGWPIVRIARQIDPLVRRSDALGFFNGHVPITAVLTAAALVAAVLDQRDAVVLSNEWSASVPTLVHEGRPVNHQWSKGASFEEAFARLVASSLGPEISVFSYLRSRSEIWVAQQFAQLSKYHRVFRSCNRSFTQNPAERLDHWCGTCDKCCFIDLVLAPFMTPAQLEAIFDGNEPLDNAELEGRFATLLGVAPEAKPFECVGDVSECRTALRLAAARSDRQHNVLLQALCASVDAATPSETDPATTKSAPNADLLAPMGPHFIPDRYAPPDLLVRAH
jgi:UDP-N-acetyl-alpha-D-muramoyl-L-alanyl-L-glutamate epimerase